MSGAFPCDATSAAGRSWDPEGDIRCSSNHSKLTITYDGAERHLCGMHALMWENAERHPINPDMRMFSLARLWDWR